MDKNKPIIKKSVAKINKAKLVDTYQDQLIDLFLLQNPHYRFIKNYKQPLTDFIKKAHQGNWFYFPWLDKYVRVLPEKDFLTVRTGRNKQIITAREQEKFYNFNIGIAGLSVGSHAAISIAVMGGGKNMKLADLDVLSPSNLNRVRYTLFDLGKAKCDLASQQIYQINPYAKIINYTRGLNEKNLFDFLAGPPKLDVLIEEMDNLEMKIAIRLAAKKLKIPVIMATDNADNIIVDVERYDQDKNLKIFNGRVGNLTLEEFKKINPADMPRLSTKIAGQDKVAPRMQKSLLQVGKTIYSWPQLGDAAMLSGVTIAYLVRRLANNQPLNSGQYEVNLDAIFDPTYYQPKMVTKRKKELKNFLNIIGL